MISQIQMRHDREGLGLVRRHMQLHSARRVMEVDEGGLSMPADGKHAPCHPGRLTVVVRVSGQNRIGQVRARIARHLKRVVPRCFERLPLRQPHSSQRFAGALLRPRRARPLCAHLISST
jgi:hypothetical protein